MLEAGTYVRSSYFKEVGFEVDIKQVASDSLNGVINRKDMDSLSVLDVCAGMNRHNVALVRLTLTFS
jgi:hypothetical protein